MDVCYCWQWGHLGAAVGLCLASALAGSTLTLLVVSFLDKRDGATGPAAVDTSGSSVAATATSTPGDGDEDALDDARLLSKEASYAPKPRREEVGANNQVDDDGAIKDNPHYRPVGARAERRISKITGSFTGVDGEKRSLASLIGEVFGDDYDDDDDNDNSKSDREKCGSISSGGCGSTRRCSISSVNVEFDAADSSEHGGTGQQRANYAEMFIDDEKALRRSQKFEEHVVSKLTSLEESKLLLHRTRAISALASPLMAAADEEACYEVVSKLLVPLFRVDRCSYALLKDAENIIIRAIEVKDPNGAKKLGLREEEPGMWSWVLPIKGTMVGLCAQTLKQQYMPQTKDADFLMAKKMYLSGVNSLLMTPILVNGVKFAGCVIVGSAQEDAFRDSDKLLIQDLASMLGANIYAKRMRRAAEKSNVIAREMLHSMIPRAVIAKIEVFWDKSTQEYRKRRSLCLADEVDTYSSTGSSCAALGRDDDDESVDSRMSGTSHNQGVSGRIEFLHQMSNAEDDTHSGCIVDTSTMRIGTLSRALYAENCKDVCIIVTDIVGFSSMALEMKPLEVMDMMHGEYDSSSTRFVRHLRHLLIRNRRFPSLVLSVRRAM